MQILLPMQTACGDFLAMIGMQDTVNTAAASCPAPLAPCTSYPEFMAYSQSVRIDSIYLSVEAGLIFLLRR